jgi:hypothetical protein
VYLRRKVGTNGPAPPQSKKACQPELFDDAEQLRVRSRASRPFEVRRATLAPLSLVWLLSMRNGAMGQRAVRKQTGSRNLLGEPCALGLIRIRILPKVSAFEQTRPEQVITLGWVGIPAWKLLGKLLATRKPKWNFWLMSVLFPDSLVRVPAWEWRAAQVFCRFPGLDSTETERLSGESRLPLLRGLLSVS